MQNNEVYLFGTCLIDSFYPESGMDAVALLELCAQHVIFPQAQTCCGQPPYNSGEKSSAKAVAWHTIQVFSQEDIPVIVPSASCAAMIKHHYPKLFEDNAEQHRQAVKLSERCFELIEFIAPRLPYHKQSATQALRVSLQRSCSALREMQVADIWLEVLEKLDHVEIILPQQEAECCGFGGTFAIKSPAISAAMTSDKCHHLLSDKPELIISGDCGCLMNIAGHLAFSENAQATMHLARFIAQRFGLAHA